MCDQGDATDVMVAEVSLVSVYDDVADKGSGQRLRGLGSTVACIAEVDPICALQAAHGGRTGWCGSVKGCVAMSTFFVDRHRGNFQVIGHEHMLAHEGSGPSSATSAPLRQRNRCGLADAIRMGHDQAQVGSW